MRRGLLLAALAALLFLGGCSAPEPEPTPEPAPSPSPPPEEIVLLGEGPEEILALAEIPFLRQVDGTGSREYEAMLELSRLRPDCRVFWTVPFEGVDYPSDTQELKASGLEGLEDALRYLPELRYVDLIDTDAVLEDMERFSALRPDIDWYWSFPFNGFTIRTDIECYSSLRDLNSPRFTDEELYPMLKYCKHLKALDLGHNDVRDLSLIGELSELEVLILADNPNLVDASPLAKLDKLIYLEFFMNHRVEDFSFLESLTAMEDLNLCYCDHLGDLDFLACMPHIRFGLFKYSGISQENAAYWREQYPQAKFIIYDGNTESCESGWRETERNEQIRRAFGLWYYITDYERWDQVSFDFSGYQYSHP